MKRIILIMSIALIAVSCQKFLDVKPVGKLIPTSIEEFNNLLNNTNSISWNYLDNNRGASLLGLSDNGYLSDIVLEYAYNTQTVNKDRVATYLFNIPYLDFTKPDYYLEWGVYRQLSYFNTAIDGVNGIEGAAETVEGKELIAQSMAGRGWAMLKATITYGPMYDKSKANDTRVLPYRFESQPHIPSSDLSTTAEMFEYVLADLTYSAENCPLRVTNPSRANRAAANAILAEAYMYMGDFEKMYTHAKQGWDLLLANAGGNTDELFYNYNDLKYEVLNPMPTPEVGADVRTLLNIESPDNLHELTYHKEMLFYRVGSSSFTYTRPTDEYLALFKEGDLRKELFVMDNIGYKQKFTGLGAGGTDVEVNEGAAKYFMRDTKIMVTQGLTNQTLLLMYAEAAARTGKSGEAMSALRILRKYRYTQAEAAIADLSGDALIAEVLRERRIELPNTTPDRFWDLKRFAVEDASKPWVKKQMTRTTTLDGTETVDINSEYYQLELGNSYRTYNPNWGLELIGGIYNPYPYPSPF